MRCPLLKSVQPTKLYAVQRSSGPRKAPNVSPSPVWLTAGLLGDTRDAVSLPGSDPLVTIGRSMSLWYRVGAPMHCPQYGRSTVGFGQVPLAPVESGPAIGSFAFFCVGLFLIVANYLVDPASSHMLVSKVTLFLSKTATVSLNQSRFLSWHDPTCIAVAIRALIYGSQHPPSGKSAAISSKPISVVRGRRSHWWIWITLCSSHGLCAGDAFFKCLLYQISIIRDMLNISITGNQAPSMERVHFKPLSEAPMEG